MEQTSPSSSGKGHPYLPGTASLVQEIDKRMLVVLRDYKVLIGYLRSVDQFGNLLLQGTTERIHIGNEYGDIPRGIYLVRGENVALCGEIDAELEAKQPLKEVSIDTILEAQRRQQEEKGKEKKKKDALLRGKGLNPLEHNEDSFT